jgi:[ribosomal protein S5]-alanine N-acetyltransferase
MHFFKAFLRIKSRYPRPSIDLRLKGPNVTLRAADSGDWRSWRNLREASRTFLTPWEPSWPGNALSYTYYCGLLRRYAREWRKGEGYNFLIFLNGKGGPLVGGISLNGVERGIAQTGTLGYWMGQAYAGHGYMREAAALVLAFAFDALQLHRLQASCLPRNEPSINLLRRLGFEEEGYAKAYLQINGKWEDHILWARVRPG